MINIIYDSDKTIGELLKFEGELTIRYQQFALPAWAIFRSTIYIRGDFYRNGVGLLRAGRMGNWNEQIRSNGPTVLQSGLDFLQDEDFRRPGKKKKKNEKREKSFPSSVKTVGQVLRNHSSRSYELCRAISKIGFLLRISSYQSSFSGDDESFRDPIGDACRSPI